MLIINLLLPLFFLTAIGWFVSKTSIFSQAWSQGVNELTSKFLIPCLLFSGMYRYGLPLDVSWSALLAYYIPLVTIFLVLVLMFRQSENYSEFSFTSIYSNTVFIGVPVVVQVFGESNLKYAFPIIAFHSLITFILYYFVDSLSSNKNIKLNVVLIKTLHNPIVASLFFGLILNVMNVSLPASITTVLSMASASALPCALLVLGASLSGFQLKGQKQVAKLVVTKLVLLPLSVLVLSHYVFHLPHAVISVLVILSACPVGVNAYAVVIGNGQNGKIVSSSILISSVLCLLTLPVWLMILNSTELFFN